MRFSFTSVSVLLLCFPLAVTIQAASKNVPTRIKVYDVPMQLVLPEKDAYDASSAPLEDMKKAKKFLETYEDVTQNIQELKDACSSLEDIKKNKRDITKALNKLETNSKQHYRNAYRLCHNEYDDYYKLKRAIEKLDSQIEDAIAENKDDLVAQLKRNKANKVEQFNQIKDLVEAVNAKMFFKELPDILDSLLKMGYSKKSLPDIFKLAVVMKLQDEAEKNKATIDLPADSKNKKKSKKK